MKFFRFNLIAAVITPVTLDSREGRLIAWDDALERNFWFRCRLKSSFGQSDPIIAAPHLRLSETGIAALRNVHKSFNYWFHLKV